VALYERARAAALAVPGVANAGVSHLTPLGGGGFTPGVAIESDAGATINIDANGEIFGNLISAGWLDTFGTRVIDGRDFTTADRLGAQRVAIVNQSFVTKLFGGNRPLGRTITIYPGTSRALKMEIVGVVEDALYSSPRDAMPATWYAPMAQFDVPGFPFTSARLSVRADGGAPILLTRSLSSALAAVNPNLSLTFRVLASQLHSSLVRERLMAQLAGFFGILALLLAGLGLYGVTAHSISRRRTEIGIRLALGAIPLRVIGLVLSRVWLLSVAGMAAGAAISLWASKFVAGLIYGLPPRDPATLATAALVLIVVATVAGWLPARRAAQTDPGIALREG
jgi:ABC-type antimicrobial peptide transport system permease subunit